MQEFDYLKTKRRYLNSIGRAKGTCTGARCGDCVFNRQNSGTDTDCSIFEEAYPEKATKLMKDWAEQNPLLTKAKDTEMGEKQLKEFDYLKTKKRYLDSIGLRLTGCGNVNCTNCMLGSKNNGTDTVCSVFEMECPEKATKLLKDWAEQNPSLTNKEMFEKTFGKSINVPSFGCSAYTANKNPVCPHFSKRRPPCWSCPWWGEEYKGPRAEEDK